MCEEKDEFGGKLDFLAQESPLLLACWSAACFMKVYVLWVARREDHEVFWCFYFMLMLNFKFLPLISFFSFTLKATWIFPLNAIPFPSLSHSFQEGVQLPPLIANNFKALPLNSTQPVLWISRCQTYSQHLCSKGGTLSFGR